MGIRASAKCEQPPQPFRKFLNYCLRLRGNEHPRGITSAFFAEIDSCPIDRGLLLSQLVLVGIWKYFYNVVVIVICHRCFQTNVLLFLEPFK